MSGLSSICNQFGEVVMSENVKTVDLLNLGLLTTNMFFFIETTNVHICTVRTKELYISFHE